MRTSIAPTALAGLALLLAAGGAVAEPKSFAIARAAEPPTIDGIIVPGEWSGAAVVTDLHQVEPVEFSAASEPTTWFLFYDDRFLYVAAIAHDSEPGSVVAQELRQGGRIRSDDSLHILLDPFNNKRSGYTFALNPNGVRADGIYTSATRLSSEWDGIWRGEATLTDDGWSMEMRIPFDTLTFDPASDRWGVNLWREIPRKDETVGWSSRGGEIDPTVSGEMHGLSGISQGKGIEAVPSLSATHIRDRFGDNENSELNPSLDVTYKVANAFNALLTINTDFAATEVDNRQLGLQRFSLFFPEKRSFFLTDFDIFQFGGVPVGTGRASRQAGLFSGTNGLAFFSRRIGLNEDREPVDILYGTKLSGRIGANDFGALYIRQDADRAIDETDFYVARVTRGVLTESTVGLIYTSGDPESNDNNSLVGADFIYRNTRIGDNRSLVGQFWVQQSDNEGVDGRDTAYSAVVSMPAQFGIEFGAQYQRLEENFRPPIGFANRVGVELFGLEIGHNRLCCNDTFIREMEHVLTFERWEYLDTGQVQSQRIGFEWFTLRSEANDRLRLESSLNREKLLPDEQPLEDIGILIPSGEHSFTRHSLSLRTAGFRPWSFELDLRGGGYFNGDRYSFSPEIEWTPNRHLSFSLEYAYNHYDFPGATATTREVTFANTIALNSKVSLSTLAQYDDVSDDVGVNMRFRYNPSAGRDLWLVVNHNWIEDPLDGRFRSDVTNAAAKIRFTMRF